MFGRIFCDKRGPGRQFIVTTDHSSLRWLNNIRQPTVRLARWAVNLSSYDFTIICTSEGHGTCRPWYFIYLKIVYIIELLNVYQHFSSMCNLLFFLLKVTMYAIFLCPLMVLRVARLALLETYDNSGHFDITYTTFVWVAFLPTCSTPLLFASWQMSRWVTSLT